MRVVVTVIGHDRIGIVAKVAATCAETNINIVDINQNITAGYFNMVLVGDLPEGLGLKPVQDKFSALGKEMGLEIRAQSELIFSAMHHI